MDLDCRFCGVELEAGDGVVACEECRQAVIEACGFGDGPDEEDDGA